MKTDIRQSLFIFWGVVSSVLGFFFSTTNAQTLADALDTTNLVWTTGGDAVWFAQTTNTFDGVDAAQSGSIQSNQTSWLETTVIGPATISFWSFTESPSGSFSSGWNFTINDPGLLQPLIPIFSSGSWSQQIYDLGDGSNVLRWTVFGLHSGLESAFVCLDEFATAPPRPLAIVNQPAGGTVYSGAQVWLAVSAIGTPPLQYQWLKNGTNLASATNSWLSFVPAVTNDSGVYSVVITNSQGWILSSNAVVTVLPPAAPFFTEEPGNATAYTGQYFQWQASVSGSPPFGFAWRKEGTNVFAGTSSWPWGNISPLTLTNVSMADGGNYTLYVTNDFGSVESTGAVLTVIQSIAPVITRQPRSLEVAEGVNTWMSVAATGVPGPWYLWTQEGVTPPSTGPLSPPGLLNPNPQQSFNNVTTNDAGIYFATVTNYAGSVTSQDALLTVLPAITKVGSYDEDAVGIFVTNGLAFLARGTNGLAILDVNNPASPQALGNCDTPGYASAVRVSDNLAFVADGSAGLQIISVTNPSNPTLVGGYDAPGYANDIAVRSNLVYVADGNDGLLILSVSNASSPLLVGSYSTNLSPSHVCLAGEFAYLTSLQSTPINGGSNDWVGGMLVVDVSDPAHPTEVVRWGGSLGTVAARDQLLFADTSVISLANPVQPVVIGALNYYSTNLVYQISASDIHLVDDLIYLADSSDNPSQLFVFDVRDPSEPIPVGHFTTEGNGSTFWVDGNYVYIAGNDAPLEIIKTPYDTRPVTAPVLSVFAQGRVQLQIQGRRGLHYEVEYTDQLTGAQWQTLQTLLLTNNNAVIQVPSGPAARFFRLKQLD